MEALILYLVLFFPGIYMGLVSPPLAGEALTIQFSLVWELNRIIIYTLPALALLWYIVLGKKNFSSLKPQKPRQQDVFSLGIGLFGLILIGIGISFVISLYSRHYGLPEPPKIEAPQGLAAWIVMVFACLSIGYLEESYFRYYLLTKLDNYNLPSKVILSTLLFAFGHIHDGPFGIINALLAGILLSVLFIRYRSLHGIALAHGFYNIFVYTMGLFIRFG